MLKKFLSGVIVIGAILGILMLNGYVDTHYKMKAKVVDVEGCEITIKDDMNNKYKFYGDNFEVNDKVVVTFDTNCTANTRKDDKIVKVKKA